MKRFICLKIWPRLPNQAKRAIRVSNKTDSDDNTTIDPDTNGCVFASKDAIRDDQFEFPPDSETEASYSASIFNDCE